MKKVTRSLIGGGRGRGWENMHDKINVLAMQHHKSDEHSTLFNWNHDANLSKLGPCLNFIVGGWTCLLRYLCCVWLGEGEGSWMQVERNMHDMVSSNLEEGWE